MTWIYIYLSKLCSTLPVRLWACGSIFFLLHFWDFIVAFKKLKLDFNISTVKWILWFQTIPGRTLQTIEWTTNRILIDVFVRGFPSFTKNEFKFIGKLDCRRVIYQYPNTINAFQLQICYLNSKIFSKIFFFCDS